MTFEQLVEAYRPMIVSVMKKLHVTNEWDEYYQVGLIALWEASQQFQPEKGSFSSFAYKKVYWSMLSHLRKQYTRTTNECSLTDEVTNVLSVTPSNDDRIVLEDVLQGLTERQQKWVIGYIVENKPLKTIAEEEGVPVGAVKQWRITALKKLRSRPWL
ncbi:sigma-70 family RNA polymerase sigma factor [Anoxybacillus sp. J5B_2022]|uniref:sigma-70 family RNA polymerase sigma factor n=1 Tax=Anoxybacillus sp. J5B_2022 TaxID=3003246 RepID=UPI00228658C5|nr:sigma-70 family RNA polymerase sigma factor [Anoxybacillus sp. J5B_2022]MCZ0755490.1 sigma-70 family RNA polymerase sigma factor [Anoxybacillus sp. J5B_2022]